MFNQCQHCLTKFKLPKEDPITDYCSQDFKENGFGKKIVKSKKQQMVIVENKYATREILSTLIWQKGIHQTVKEIARYKLDNFDKLVRQSDSDDAEARANAMKMRMECTVALYKKDKIEVDVNYETGDVKLLGQIKPSPQLDRKFKHLEKIMELYLENVIGIEKLK